MRYGIVMPSTSSGNMYSIGRLTCLRKEKMPSDPVPVITNYLATNPGLKPAQNHQTANCFDKKSPCLQMFCFPRVFAKVKGIHPAQSSMPLFNTMGTLGTASGGTARIWELVASYIILNQAGQKTSTNQNFWLTSLYLIVKVKSLTVLMMVDPALNNYSTKVFASQIPYCWFCPCYIDLPMGLNVWYRF